MAEKRKMALPLLSTMKVWGGGREKLSPKDRQTDGQEAQKDGALPHPDLLVTVVRVQVLQGDADDFRWGVPIDER